MTTFTTQDRQEAERVTQESWMAGVRALAAIIDSHIIASKPLNKWLAPKPLTDDEVGYFTHQMILCSGQHPAAADINILGLIDIVRAIERAHGIGE
jgi:hypothetical protein